MSNYQLEKDEVILFEGQVIVEEFKSEVKFTLTSKKMVFEKEEGIFKRKLKVIDIIPLINIKVYKECSQILDESEKKINILVQTNDKNITLSCSNAFEANKIVEEMINIKIGSNILERSLSKLKEAVTAVNDTKDVVVEAAGIAVSAYQLLNRRKK